MKHLLSAILVLSSFFSYSQSPGSTARISVLDSVVCSGECITLSSSTSAAGSSPIINTIWSINGPCNYNKAAQTTVGTNLVLCDITCTGDYQVSIINQHQNAQTSVAFRTVKITISANPIADLQAVVNSCNLPFAVSYNIGGSTQGLPNSAYVWSFNGGSPNAFTGTVPPTVNYNTAGTFDSRLIVSDPTSGCKDTVVRSMTINQFDAGISNQATACVGETVQFTDASTIGANSWAWSTATGGTFSNSGDQDSTDRNYYNSMWNQLNGQ